LSIVEIIGILLELEFNPNFIHFPGNIIASGNEIVSDNCGTDMGLASI